MSEHLPPLLQSCEKLVQCERCVCKFLKHRLEYGLLERSFSEAIWSVLASLLLSKHVVEWVVYADKRNCLTLRQSERVVQSKVIKSHVASIRAISVDNHDLLRDSLRQDVYQTRIVVFQLGIHSWLFAILDHTNAVDTLFIQHYLLYLLEVFCICVHSSAISKAWRVYYSESCIANLKLISSGITGLGWHLAPIKVLQV